MYITLLICFLINNVNSFHHIISHKRNYNQLNPVIDNFNILPKNTKFCAYNINLNMVKSSMDIEDSDNMPDDDDHHETDDPIIDNNILEIESIDDFNFIVYDVDEGDDDDDEPLTNVSIGSSQEIMMTNDDSKEHEEEEFLTWTERRKERKRKSIIKEMEDPNTEAKKQSWEEKFEDDAMRSESPTQDLHPPEKLYQKQFIAIAKVTNDDQRELREHGWSLHMQWTRRSALVPEYHETQVDWEYTMLSKDCMEPVGQIVGISANDKNKVLEYMEQEPLQMIGAIDRNKWDIFELAIDEDEALDMTSQEMQAFVGLFDESKGISEKDMEKYSNKDIDEIDNDSFMRTIRESKNYHKNSGRINTLAGLKDINDGTTMGHFLLINSKTNADSERYFENDPNNLYSETLLSPINVQDVDGLNHMMARTFSQKSELDQLHYMDPEDLISPEYFIQEEAGKDTFMESIDESIQKLVAQSNKEAMQILAHTGKSYRYDRLDTETRHGGYLDQDDIDLFNESMERNQHVRLKKVVESEGSDE